VYKRQHTHTREIDVVVRIVEVKLSVKHIIMSILHNIRKLGPKRYPPLT